jgi:hypothetical protein
MTTPGRFFPEVPNPQWVTATEWAESGFDDHGPEIDYGMRWGPNRNIRVSYSPNTGQGLPGHGRLYAHDPTHNRYTLLAADTTDAAVDTAWNTLLDRLPIADALVDFTELIPLIPSSHDSLEDLVVTYESAVQDLMVAGVGGLNSAEAARLQDEARKLVTRPPGHTLSPGQQARVDTAYIQTVSRHHDFPPPELDPEPLPTKLAAGAPQRDSSARTERARSDLLNRIEDEASAVTVTDFTAGPVPKDWANYLSALTQFRRNAELTLTAAVVAAGDNTTDPIISRYEMRPAGIDGTIAAGNVDEAIAALSELREHAGRTGQSIRVTAVAQGDFSLPINQAPRQRLAPQLDPVTSTTSGIEL